MHVNPMAGKPATASMLVNVPKLITAYYSERPDPAVPAQRVAFGTSGHRGSAFELSFNEWHILATTQAIAEYRRANPSAWIGDCLSHWKIFLRRRSSCW